MVIGMMRSCAVTRAITLSLALFTLLLLVSTRHVAAVHPNSPYYGANRRIAMDAIRTLTFYADRSTAYRRTSPLPQLTCVGSPCSKYQPDVVQCQAMGDGQWKCSADLPVTMRMGRVEVSCEGYDYADDPYVLKDSCALTYHLLSSGKGPDDPWRTYERNKSGWSERLAKGLFQMLFWGILVVIVVGFFRAIRDNANTTNGRDGGGGGGGGGWWPGGFSPHQSPPPPYTPKPDPHAPSSSSSWRPGFWTGLSLGGLAATLTASARNRQNHFPPQDTPYYNNDYAFGPSSSNFGDATRRRRWDDDRRGFGESSSVGLRESTGFGGTRNR